MTISSQFEVGSVYRAELAPPISPRIRACGGASPTLPFRIALQTLFKV
jgi:hypothetical protein